MAETLCKSCLHAMIMEYVCLQEKFYRIKCLKLQEDIEKYSIKECNQYSKIITSDDLERIRLNYGIKQFGDNIDVRA